MHRASPQTLWSARGLKISGTLTRLLSASFPGTAIGAGPGRPVQKQLRLKKRDEPNRLAGAGRTTTKKRCSSRAEGFDHPKVVLWGNPRRAGIRASLRPVVCMLRNSRDE